VEEVVKGLLALKKGSFFPEEVLMEEMEGRGEM